MKLGRYAEAIAHYRRCLEIQPDNGLAIQGLLEVCHASDQVDGVGPAIEQFLQKHPGNLEILLCKARLQVHRGQAKDASQTLLTILALDPSMAGAHQLLAQVQANG